MKLNATAASVLIRVLRTHTVQEAPVSNNVRALIAAIVGASNYPSAISTETRTLVRAFQGDLTVNPTSENGRAIVEALRGHDRRSGPISNTVRDLITAILTG